MVANDKHPTSAPPNDGIPSAPDTPTGTVDHCAAVNAFLQAIRRELTDHPIDFRGFHDSITDLIYAFYTEYVPLETPESRKKHLVAMEAVLKILVERDEARGVETELADQPQGYRYNKEVEDIESLFSQEVSEIEKTSFAAGFAAGARLVFEAMGEGAVGVKKNMS